MREQDYLLSTTISESMAHVFSDDFRFETWSRVEVALVRALAKHGLIPEKTIQGLESALHKSSIDKSRMRDDFRRIGFPVLPFIRQLTDSCDPETARWVHYGATTQDVIDTGTVIQIREGLRLIEEDVDGIIDALVDLSKKHRDTVMAGRTFQQLAAPITFGYKAAIWLDEIIRHEERLNELKPRVLVGQCAGAVGTFATLGDAGLAVQKTMMEILGLEVPIISWHVARDSWAELISVFTMISATLGKIATEIAMLMRSEIGEVSEPFEAGRGASTTLPHKRNPISCEPIIAIAHRMRELAGSQYTAMIQEHERGVGQMHLEWLVMPDAFMLLSGALYHAKYLLRNLTVDQERMRKNLMINGGQIMSEAVMMALASRIGKKAAHETVCRAANKVSESGLPLKDALFTDAEISGFLSETEIESLMDPSGYLGSAGTMVDRVLARAAQRKRNNE